jgi:hypothetical protein
MYRRAVNRISRSKGNDRNGADSSPSRGEPCRAGFRPSETFLAHAEMDASLKFNTPAYACAILSTDDLMGKLLPNHQENCDDHDPIASSVMEANITMAHRARSGCRRQQRNG